MSNFEDVQADEVVPFTLQVPQARIDELRERLAATRWPDALPDVGWAYGVPLDLSA